MLLSTCKPAMYPDRMYKPVTNSWLCTNQQLTQWVYL